MANTVASKLEEILNKEKWTRAAINNYTITNFKEMDELLEETLEDSDEVVEICQNHLEHAKNSIIALYLSGIINLRHQVINDANLVQLTNIFIDNRKWNIVEYLCLKILEQGENKFALRTLDRCYEEEGEAEKRFLIWERLIKVDFEEADLIKLLAERAKEASDQEKAIEYYKKALHRFINKNLFSNVKEVWQELLALGLDEYEFFEHINRKVAKTIGAERATQLLEILYHFYKDKQQWQTCINILKQMLDYEAKNSSARQEIVYCYEQKHSGHSQLSEYIKLSNLNQSWRNIHDAIADFEKHIYFDVGNFVYHRTWGIGRIKDITSDELVINFIRKADHRMSIKMAVNALTYLVDNHIWVLKVSKKHDVLQKKIKEDPVWTLKTIIKSHNNMSSMKTVKAEIVPSFLSEKEWASWSQNARKILKNDPVFGNIAARADYFTVRDKPISKEEKAFNTFKAAKNFFTRYQAMLDFLRISDPESEFFEEIFAYFNGFLKAHSNVNEQVICSYFIVNRLIKQFPFLDHETGIDFIALLDKVEDLDSLFVSIENTNLRNDFLLALQGTPQWPQHYVTFFLRSLHPLIISELEKHNKQAEVNQIVEQIFNNFREYRDAFLWLVKNNQAEHKQIHPDFEFDKLKLLSNLIHLLDITLRELDGRINLTANRRTHKQIIAILFTDGLLIDYCLSESQEKAVRVYTLINDVKDLDVTYKIDLKNKLAERFPDFHFQGREITRETVSRGLLVLEKSYHAKQKELRQILDVEIPKNSKEIGAAIELGDLSENAEYKAGKEKQELLNLTANKIQDELDRAQIHNLDQIRIDSVSFGTRNTLLNDDTGETEIFTVLGPWESDPGNNIISYQSPLGAKLLNHKIGDTINFTINERSFNFTVKKIEKFSD